MSATWPHPFGLPALPSSHLMLSPVPQHVNLPGPLPRPPCPGPLVPVAPLPRPLGPGPLAPLALPLACDLPPPWAFDSCLLPSGLQLPYKACPYSPELPRPSCLYSSYSPPGSLALASLQVPCPLPPRAYGTLLSSLRRDSASSRHPSFFDHGIR
jgi:hypothetical protein